MQSPLISCLCITNNRPAYLKRAIECFNSQTYLNKEFIIVTLTNDLASRHVAESFNSDRIKVMKVSERSKISLGELRNLAISKCKGEYFCQWDDDDWCHNERLRLQMNAITQSGKFASILPNWILYDLTKRKSYLSNFGPWAGSILCHKGLFDLGIRYPAVDKNEDSLFLNQLFKINCLHSVAIPYLYIYVFHGNNTCDSNHFNIMFQEGKILSRRVNEIIKNIIEGKISNKEGSLLLASLMNESVD